ncbi:MAG TPA: M24 family metallopeptidase [Thermoguttaceae bacterium]|nr:M24 family metallopeptidase [Thermoguttaceae bacterium]
MTDSINVLPMRRRDEVVTRVLRKRLETIVPRAMRAAGIDMWLILCQEDDYEPVFKTMTPINTWAPILQMLIFFDPGEGRPVERINLSMTNLGDLFEKPWAGVDFNEQWKLLAELIQKRDPRRIGLNIGKIQWAAGGLTHNLYNQLVDALPKKYVERFVSAEPVVTAWLANLTDEDIELFEHVVHVAKAIIAGCYSRRSIVPGVTTIEELMWTYWQALADLGLGISFKPFFKIVRSAAAKKQFGEADQVIRPGDFVHCDVGIRYLRLNSDHQQWAYVLRPGETDAPEGTRRIMAQAHRLQDVFLGEFKHGSSGNEMLGRILARAHEQKIPNPKIYSHSLGLYLHEPGPLIGLPWEQKCCEGRGDVRLDYGNAFTMELSVEDTLAEWGGESFRMSIEEDVVFTREGCRLLGGRQTAFHLV